MAVVTWTSSACPRNVITRIKYHAPETLGGDVHHYTDNRQGTRGCDDLQLMKDAGCFSIIVGVESASRQTLDKINKKIRLDKTIKMIQEARERGVEIGTSQIIGFPWETKEDILATLTQYFRFYDMGVTSSDVVALMPKRVTDAFPGIPFASDLDQIEKITKERNIQNAL